MAIGVKWQDFLEDEAFNRSKRPARCNIVGIDQVPDAVGAFDPRRCPDEIIPQEVYKIAAVQPSAKPARERDVIFRLMADSLHDHLPRLEC